MSKIPVFDIGDTLTPARNFSRKVFREELGRQGVENPPEYPFSGYNEYVEESVREWLEDEGVEADVEKMLETYRNRKETGMERRNVSETLRRIGQGIETPGIVSDNSLEAKKFFQRLFGDRGVEIDGFVVSEEIGVRKPKREIFQKFVERRGVEPERCVYFGNRADIDSACRKAGMEFVWVTEHDTFETSWNGLQIDKLEFENVRKAIEEVERDVNTGR